VAAGALALTGLAAALPVDGAEAHGHPRPVPVPALSWQDCGDGVQCATATVPLDHDRPHGATIELAVARRPATDPAHRIGSLFVNNGGPGNSVLDFVRGDAQQVVPADVRARFDIVGFDPRGVGQSTPVRCFADADQQQAFFGPLPPFPVGSDDLTTFTEASKEIGQRCLARNGELLSHLSTANVARDLDLLRRAVGDAQLSFAGYSYGGLLGLTYGQLFPGKVRSLLLDGTPDPVAWSTGRGKDRSLPFSTRLDSAVGTSDTMGFFLDRCQDAGPEACAFAADAPAGTRAKFDALMAQLRIAPAVIETPDGVQTFTYAQVVDALRGALQFPPIWGDVAGLLQASVAAPPAAANVATASTKAPASGGAAAAAPDDGYDNSHEALLAVACSETDNPDNPGRWAKAAERADRDAPYFGSDWTFLTQPCATWPVQDHDRYRGRYDAKTAHPVLFVSSRFDAANPHEAAVRTAADVPGARLLTLDGAGHPATFVPNSCLDHAVSGYLLGGQLPPAGATCEPEVRPFS
jgi:pimeloyl-ACP methyl ester carboxylesterase